MSTQSWQRIDKFFPIYVVALIMLAGLVILTFRGIFSAVTIGYEAEENSTNELKIDRGQLDAALKATFERESIPLEVTE